MLEPRKPEIVRLPLAALQPHPLQPLHYDEGSAEEVLGLADDMNRNGQRDAVVVMPHGNKVGLPANTLLDGHRRKRAAELLGWMEIDAVVRHDLVDAEAAVVEDLYLSINLPRQHLHSLDRAALVLRRYEIEKRLPRGGLRHSDHEREARDRVGALLGISGRHLQRLYRILLLPRPIRRAVRDGHLRMTLAEQVESLDVAVQEEIAAQIAALDDPAGAQQIVAARLGATDGRHGKPATRLPRGSGMCSARCTIWRGERPTFAWARSAGRRPSCAGLPHSSATGSAASRDQSRHGVAMPKDVYPVLRVGSGPAEPVRIIMHNDHAVVTAPMAVRALLCDECDLSSLVRSFGMDASGRLTEGFIPQVFYGGFDPRRDRLVIGLGLLPAVVEALTEHGIPVHVAHEDRFGPQFAQDAHALARLGRPWQQRLAAALAAHPAGQLHVRGTNDLIGVLVAMARLYPRLSVLLLTATRHQARWLRYELQRELRERVDREYGVNPPARLVASTFIAPPDPNRFGLVVVPFADDLGGDRAYGCLVRTLRGVQRRYVIVHRNHLLDSHQGRTVDGLFGPRRWAMQEQAETAVLVERCSAWSPAPHRPCPGLDWKRAAVWSNRRRNEVIARVAQAMRRRDIPALWNDGLLLDHRRFPAELGDGGTVRVAVLVEGTEHGRALSELLPDWPLRCGGTGTTEPAGVIATMVWGAEHSLDCNVLIRADGTAGMPLGGFPAGQRRQVLLVDADDAGDNQAGLISRLRAYRQRGWRLQKTAANLLEPQCAHPTPPISSLGPAPDAALNILRQRRRRGTGHSVPTQPHLDYGAYQSGASAGSRYLPNAPTEQEETTNTYSGRP